MNPPFDVARRMSPRELDGRIESPQSVFFVRHGKY
jgi:hypothetical protein